MLLVLFLGGSGGTGADAGAGAAGGFSAYAVRSSRRDDC